MAVRFFSYRHINLKSRLFLEGYCALSGCRITIKAFAIVEQFIDVFLVGKKENSSLKY